MTDQSADLEASETDEDSRSSHGAVDAGRSTSWMAKLAHALHHIGQISVDVAAIAGLVVLALRADPSVIPEVGGMIVTVAVGKRYIDRKRRENTGEGQ